MDVCTNCGCIIAGGETFIPAPHLIDADTSPSESKIQATLLKMDSDLAQLDGKIDQVQATLDDFQKKRQVLSDVCYQHRALLSPIKRLPHEILSEILILSLPDLDMYNIFTFRRVVMLPAIICMHWRDVALSTPRLWSSVSFGLYQDDADGNGEYVAYSFGDAPFSHRMAR